MKIKTCSLFLLLCLLLDACIQKSTIPKQSKTNTSINSMEFLDQNKCKLPCWEGITPGLTSMKEVWDLVSKNKIIKNANWYVSSKTIEWNLSDSDISTKAIGDYEDGLLNNLYFSLYGKTFPLNDFINIYGPPTYVDLGWSDPEHCYVSFIYLSIGISLDTNLECNHEGFFSSENYYQVSVSEDTPIQTITLHRPGKSGYIKTYGTEAVSNLSLEWHGFGDYEETY